MIAVNVRKYCTDYGFLFRGPPSGEGKGWVSVVGKVPKSYELAEAIERAVQTMEFHVQTQGATALSTSLSANGIFTLHEIVIIP